jgi:hypothetical protein
MRITEIEVLIKIEVHYQFQKLIKIKLRVGIQQASNLKHLPEKKSLLLSKKRNLSYTLHYPHQGIYPGVKLRPRKEIYTYLSALY